MNILLISQCDKRALTETRRILDQFAERRGDRTWQTSITEAGLNTLRRLLRKTARKNTAVACHWIRGLDHSELLWVVGGASRFNDQGAVPTDTTTRNVLRQQDENDWHRGEDIYLLTAVAALLHDLGKASQAFQWRLAGKLIERNIYRHEWVSLRLFEAFVGGDDDATWLARLADPTSHDDASWIDRLHCDGLVSSLPAPFSALAKAPLAQAIGWLVVTHHRLPVAPAQPEEGSAGWLGSKRSWVTAATLQGVLNRIDASWNETPGSDDVKAIAPYWHFPHGLPVTTDLWRKSAARLAKRLLIQIVRPEKSALHAWLGNPYLMHVSRLCLMLADHHYSRLKGSDEGRVKVPAGYPLYANTTGSSGAYNQTLDEHLIGVAQHGSAVTHSLPLFEHQLPRLANHKGLRKRSQDERFHWQDKAADLVGAMRERAVRQGAFIVNMASTGTGKTLANARVMYALADPKRGMRCAFAMGLRTLTLQTGRAFRDLLHLKDDDLAIRVGGVASRELSEYYERQAFATGSASSQDLMDEGSHVVYEGDIDHHPLLQRVMHDQGVRALLVAPVLVSTIDHLTPATESQRGGRQIAPMLRLMSSDLVLDEPDDFDVDDLPALNRLVHWAGMLGARVLLSSATLPPALVQGLFEAYRAGREQYERNRGELIGNIERAPKVCCAWVDEFHQAQSDCTDSAAFLHAHRSFVAQRCDELARIPVRRRCELQQLPLAGLSRQLLLYNFSKLAREAASTLHKRHHTIDPRSTHRVSFGLIRMANIEPLIEAALELFKLGAPDGMRIHLCVYHSQFPLLIRSAIERRLDTTLNRHAPNSVFDLPEIRQLLDLHNEPDQLFIVLGSPVTEVGRDHDYDWAVVEPSSMRSLIQLAGRVRRHRSEPCSIPNIVVFDTNLRHFLQPGQPAFCKPGFETVSFPLQSHSLSVLWPESTQEVIDARPRIASPSLDELKPRSRLVDLEHMRIGQTMLVHKNPNALTRPGQRQRGSAKVESSLLNAASWWYLDPVDALLTAVLPQQQPFRHDGANRVDLVLRPNDDIDDIELVRLQDKPGGRRGEKVFLVIERSQHHRITDKAVRGQGIAPWGETEYLASLSDLAAEMDLSLDECARRYGGVSVPENDNGWRYHPVLGFSKYKQEGA